MKRNKRGNFGANSCRNILVEAAEAADKQISTADLMDRSGANFAAGQIFIWGEFRLTWILFIHVADFSMSSRVSGLPSISFSRNYLYVFLHLKPDKVL